MADSSFDIVSKIDRQEVDNALGQTAQEVATRFDFKGTGAKIEWKGDEAIEITASADDRASAVLDVFKQKLIKRQVSLKVLDASEPAPVGPGVQDRHHAQGGHLLRGREEDPQADPRRGSQGRQGADPGRRAPRLLQEARRPPGRSGAGQGAGLRVRGAVRQLPVRAEPRADGRHRAADRRRLGGHARHRRLRRVEPVRGAGRGAAAGGRWATRSCCTCAGRTAGGARSPERVSAVEPPAHVGGRRHHRAALLRLRGAARPGSGWCAAPGTSACTQRDGGPTTLRHRRGVLRAAGAVRRSGPGRRRVPAARRGPEGSGPRRAATQVDARRPRRPRPRAGVPRARRW